MSVRPVVAVTRSSALDWVSRWFLYGVAFLFPLAFLPSVADEFVLPKLLLMRAAIAGMALLLASRWIRDGIVRWRRTPLDLPLLAFAGSAAVSTVLATNRNLAIFGSYDRWEGLLTIVSYALLFWLTVQLCADASSAAGMIWSVLASGYLIGIAAVLQSGFALLGGGYFLLANGIIRADVTMANPDFLGIFLAMLLPLAASKVLGSGTTATRVLGVNLVVVLALGLVATFTRAAWLAAVFGIVLVLALRRGRFRPVPLVLAVTCVLIGLLALTTVEASRPSASTTFGRTLLTRVLSITNVSGNDSQAKRIGVWADTLPLIASRPLVGYGPDNFALVYPKFESEPSSRVSYIWDKPHQDALGVTAAQGIVGLVAYLWILATFVWAFWQGRSRRGAVGLFGAWIAYVVAIQADFSWIPTAGVFWILSAAAVVTWAPKSLATREIHFFPRRVAVPLFAAGVCALTLALVPAVVLPYLADAAFYAAPASANLDAARATISDARRLTPYEAQYAMQAGYYALNLDLQGNNPGPNADWVGARDAFETAARLGSYDPTMYRELAGVDEHMGDHRAALAAAERALQLDRFDPRNQRLLAQLRAEPL